MTNSNKRFDVQGFGSNDPLEARSPFLQTAAVERNEASARDADDGSLPALIELLSRLQQNIKESWSSVQGQFDNIRPSNRASARNLVHYLALRRHDIRTIQHELARNGISSLGRAESHVMSNLNKVLKLLNRTLGQRYEPPEGCDGVLSFDLGTQYLVERTISLLGPEPGDRKVRIMVTLPSEAAHDYALVRDLVAGGMDCARINCAHDASEAWQRMVDNIHRASDETGRPCKIIIDLAGPKLRTGAFEPGPQVVKWRPARDDRGQVLKPARIWLSPSTGPIVPPEKPSATLHFPDRFLDHLKIDDRLKFVDARGARGSLTIVSHTNGGCWAEAAKTNYVVPETIFKIHRKGHRIKRWSASPEAIPNVEQSAFLRKGDPLVITRTASCGRPAVTDPNGEILEPASITLSLPEIFGDIGVGEKIWFDDGKLGGTVTAINENEIRVEISHAGPAGHRLRADIGINLPKTRLSLSALTDKDLKDLPFIADHADAVGCSFVRTADDVRRLQEQLKNMGKGELGIILKIETRAAFDNLPEILLSALESPVVGVMIARGDLAVEVGFQRMAEIQEEILWMCEAAHIPVIWATQVLERLSKKGEYSRAEITDAAMSERAECVMLNKGPYILGAVRTLDDILKRMQAHQEKKRSMMRPLKLAERFFSKRVPKHDWVRSASD
jgi:pyruvate kinase